MPIENLDSIRINQLIDIMGIVHKTSVQKIIEILKRLNNNLLISLDDNDKGIINNWYKKLEELERTDRYKAGKCIAYIILYNLETRRPGLMKELGIQL